MLIRPLLVATVAAVAGGLSAAEPSDFAVWAECASGEETAVLVVGAWEADIVQGWTWSLSYDPADAAIGTCSGEIPSDRACDGSLCPQIRCPPEMAAPGPAGQSASYHTITVGDGTITQEVVLDFLATWTGLGYTDRFEMLEISYTLTAESATLAFLGPGDDPPSEVGFICNGLRIVPGVQEGITLPCTPPAGPFKRGDVNTDDALDVADPVFTLSYLFARGPAPTCLDAADANDDGTVDVADAVAVLSHLFAGAGPLPAPFGECGADPTPEDRELGCASFRPCGHIPR